MIVTASKLNVRSAPGTNFAVLRQLNQGASVAVQEASGDWVRIDPCGWVARTWLSAPQGIAVPNGLAGIRARFGEATNPAASAGMINFPAPLRMGGSQAVTTRAACHIEMVQLFTRVFGELHARELWPLIKSYDGLYNPRMKRSTGNSWSTHAWGIAVDLNASTNQQGTVGDMDHRIIAVFERHGFYWGGKWSGRSRDPMHFQYAVGY